MVVSWGGLMVGGVDGGVGVRDVRTTVRNLRGPHRQQQQQQQQQPTTITHHDNNNISSVYNGCFRPPNAIMGNYIKSRQGTVMIMLM